MAISKSGVVQLYGRRAARYDITANLYYLVGFREQAYRKRAVAALALKPGDTVVDIGCGTGLNFSLLQRIVGPQGRIIGVDLTGAMLEQAARRVEKHGWRNVELVQADASQYAFAQGMDGVLSTFALTMVPEYDKVIQNAAAALKPGKRFVVLDLKKPERAPRWLINLGVLITRPFGVSLDMAQRKPWESMRRYFANYSNEQLYGGMAYIAVGENPAKIERKSAVRR